MNLSEDKQLLAELLNLPGWLTSEEGLFLYELAKKVSGKVIVEIGSFKGKSTIFMGFGIKESKTKKTIYAIDPHKGKLAENRKALNPTYDDFKKNIKKYNLDSYIKPILKTSRNSNKGWKIPISLIFIDGLHEYEYVKSDIKLWMKKLDDKGIIAFHDAFAPYPDVFKAVREEIFNNKNFRVIGYSGSIIYAIKGKPCNYQEKLKLYLVEYLIFIAWSIWQIKFIPEHFQFKIVNRIKQIIPKYNFSAELKKPEVYR